jgi:cytosine/adenosine deaminase-related metal-dependent hydrolase
MSSLIRSPRIKLDDDQAWLKLSCAISPPTARNHPVKGVPINLISAYRKARPQFSRNRIDIFIGPCATLPTLSRIDPLRPVRSMLDAGVRVSLASDHPCGSFSPTEIIWTAVTRQSYKGTSIDAAEAITPEEALRLYTINAAHASNRADRAGSIEVGKIANLVVLDRDIVTCAHEDIRHARVELTYVDGMKVFERAKSGNF